MITLANDLIVQVSRFGASTFRIRANLSGQFTRSLPEHLGFVESGEPVDVLKDSDGKARFTCGSGAKLAVDVISGEIHIVSADGTPVTTFRLTMKSSLGGPGITAAMDERMGVANGAHEAFYGLGFQRTSLNLRGQALNWQRTYRSREATVPFFMSNAGYGFYSNNTWHHLFDFTGDAECSISASGGEIDFYLFIDDTMTGVLDSYTALTGRPQLLPRWAMGLLYICRYFENQTGVIDIAKGFRDHNIPCDMIGLEPGWEDVPYSMSWEWSPDRFPDPARMIEQLHDLDYRFELWESGTAPKLDYLNPEVRNDWYSQRVKNSIDMGVDFYKQDDPYPRMLGTDDEHDMKRDSELEGFGPVSGEAAANLANSLYSQTAFDEFTRITGKRAITMFHSYMASVASHRWGYGWAGDFAAGCGLLCASLSGHSTVSLDMHTEDPAGIHYAFFTPVALIDSWASYKEPWLYSKPHEQMIRNYSSLRQRLWPYLYQTHLQSTKTGIPMMRPMALEAQDDPNVAALTGQHMLGDSFLVGLCDSDDRQVYLPRGRWIDFWTGDAVISEGEWASPETPPGVGGPLYLKAGAVVPTAPIATHVGTEPLELVLLDCYPWGETHIEIYDDDGQSCEYAQGATAHTPVTCRRTDERVDIEIGPRDGSFDGMSLRRAYLIRLFVDTVPDSVETGESQLPHAESVRDLLSGWRSGWCVDPVEGCVLVKPSKHWRVTGDVSSASSAGIDAAHIEWADDAAGITFVGRIAVHPGADDVPRSRIGFADTKQSASPVGALELTITANPPERVALKGGGTWLAYKTTIFGAVYKGGQLDTSATNPVRLEVTDSTGRLIQKLELTPENGEVVYRNIEYRPTVYHFRLVCGDTSSETITIRDIPEVPGVKYDELLETKSANP